MIAFASGLDYQARDVRKMGLMTDRKHSSQHGHVKIEIIIGTGTGTEKRAPSPHKKI